MDKEKAIQILKRCEAESYCSHYKQHHCCIGCGQREALDLAIEALSDMSEEEVDYCNKCPYISYNGDCISRQNVIEAVRLATAEKRTLGRGDILDILYSTPPVTPPKRVVAEVKVDTEELVKRIKEEYQLEQEHGRLIDADKLLQDLFTVDEEEWTTPEIRAILENAPSVTPTERTGEWIESEIPNELYVCSECGGACWSYDYERNIVKSNYCPNCGADMRGDNK